MCVCVCVCLENCFRMTMGDVELSEYSLHIQWCIASNMGIVWT